MITNQAYLFLIFTLNGFIIGLLFDIFRILRKCFKTPNLVTYAEDILFWILTGFLILYSIFIFNNGEIRFFMFIGIGIGIAFYMLLLSKHIIKICIYIIERLKKIFIIIKKAIIIPIKLISTILKTIFLNPIKFMFINFKNVTKYFQNLPKKLQKKRNLKIKVE